MVLEDTGGRGGPEVRRFLERRRKEGKRRKAREGRVKGGEEERTVGERERIGDKS